MIARARLRRPVAVLHLVLAIGAIYGAVIGFAQNVFDGWFFATAGAPLVAAMALGLRRWQRHGASAVLLLADAAYAVLAGILVLVDPWTQLVGALPAETVGAVLLFIAACAAAVLVAVSTDRPVGRANWLPYVLAVIAFAAVAVFSAAVVPTLIPDHGYGGLMIPFWIGLASCVALGAVAFAEAAALAGS